MRGLKRFAACAAMAASVIAWEAAAQTSRSIEQTLSYQMLQAEAGFRQVPAAKFTLLRSVLDRAATAGRAQHWRPDTRREAIDVLDAVQVVFAQHNFIQPTLPEDWTDTLGDALEPLRLSNEQRRRLLAPGELNGFRARYIDPTQPLYFIDDDAGAQLFVSVGQRLGWDIRLVQASERYFVRWQVSATETLNWDWTAGGPTRNEAYPVGEGRFYRDWPARRRDLKSLPLGYARAHYLYLIARQVPGPQEKRNLLERAMGADATHELTQNGLAWLYATDRSLGRGYGRLAVQYALSAWAAGPRDPTVADTVACAFAAAGDRGLAVQVERFAIARLRDARLFEAIPAYEARLAQMDAGDRCSG